MSKRHLSFVLPLLGALALGSATGCDGQTEAPDAGRGRDAAVSDAGGLLDAGPPTPRPDAGPAAFDASASTDAGAALCSSTECDPRSPDGCASGSSCVLWTAEGTCESSPGSLTADVECATVSDCAPGLACFLVDGRGVCGRICCPGDGASCAEGSTCGGSGVLVDGTGTSWGRCRPTRTCDIFDPAADCEPREGCYVYVQSDAVTTECRVAGTAGSGAACTVQEDCQPGFFCGGVPTKRCVRICRLGEMDCPSGEGRCVRSAPTPEGTGVCTVDTSSP